MPSLVLAFSTAAVCVLGRPVPLTESLWTRIDGLNASIKAASVPADAKQVSAWLEEAVKIVEALDPDYQKVRANAFETDFTQADALVARAAPALTLAFYGDYDTELVSYKTFARLPPPASAVGRFFALFKSTYAALSDGVVGAECLLPFNLPAPKAAGMTPAKKADAAKKWAALAPELPPGILSTYAATAGRCLTKKTGP